MKDDPEPMVGSGTVADRAERLTRTIRDQSWPNLRPRDSATLILIDRSATVLAVAARSPADERSLMRDAEDVTTIELKVADVSVGQLRMRAGETPPEGSVLRLVTTLVASEVERVRAPERASEEAATSFQRAVLDGRIDGRDDLVARGK